MLTYSLNGKWTMTRVKTGENFSVDVPSDNYTELYKLGAIPDPFFRDNESRVSWVGREDWTYSRSFFLGEEDLLYQKMILSCLSLDTLAEVYLNGNLVGVGNNAHKKYEFNLKPYANIGENEITVKFFSPVLFAEKMQKKSPLTRNNNGTDGIGHIRKPHCHFGWDWGPHIPLCGITDDISVELFDERLVDFRIEQTHRDGAVTLKITPTVEGAGEITATVTTPIGEILSFVNNEIVIKNPELWWTKELSGKDTQPLYEVAVTFGDTVLTKKIGLRTVELDRSKDIHGGNFRFLLNGVPIFGKGANWILPDSLMGRVTASTYDYYIDTALSSHFNMLRIWGGAYYGSDYFYSRCDEKGLLLWQDFQFACLTYPLWEEDFVDNVLGEIEYNVNRLRHHPSLLLWCGNNEIEDCNSYLPKKGRIMRSYERFFYHTLADTISRLDPDTPYIPSSPVGESFAKKVYSDNYGDSHTWAVWHGQKPLNFYRKRFPRFCSEFGMESLPSMDAVGQFCEEKDRDILSETFNSHQKCHNGNRKMLYYILERFYPPKEFDDLIYLTQLTQKECISDATEHWRRNRGVCNGSIYWQFNDCWQAPSWSSVDYTGKWKALQYSARRFFSPFTISIEEEKKGYAIHLTNDLTVEKNAFVEITLSTLEGKVLSAETLSVTAPPLSTAILKKGKIIGNEKEIFLVARLIDGERTSERTKIFCRDRDLRLKPADIKKSVEFSDGILTLKLSSDTFCRSVMLDIAGVSTPFSDNYFDLLPNEEKTVTLSIDRPIHREEITVKCLNNVTVSDKPNPKLYRAKFFFEPYNFIKWLWHTIK